MKVYLDTVGCRLNQAELETMAGQFRAAGLEIVGMPGQADLAVVNTCTVTGQAAADSRALIRRISAQGGGGIVVTGCWATMRPAEAASMPRVLKVVSNASKEALVPAVLESMGAAGVNEAVARKPIPGARHRTRAFIKVQDGCDNHCSFCVTTVARGRGRSRAEREVVTDVRRALEGGAKEIVLTGVHLGSWGADRGIRLRDLVRTILNETETPRLRLSSLEPWDLDAGFFDLWDDSRLCRHLHLPLQSGCAATLRRMRRRTTPDAFRALILAVRSRLPDAAITTDVIAGFPGETEAEFRSSLDFVHEMEFSGGHAFTYSPMAETAAARMPGQVPLADRRGHTRLFMDVFDNASRAFRVSQLAGRRPVLWESAVPAGSDAWTLGGLTDNYIRVQAAAPDPRWNQIDLVLLQEDAGDRVHGIVVKSG